MSVHIFGAAFGLALAWAKGDAPVVAYELEESIASEKGHKVRVQLRCAPGRRDGRPLQHRQQQQALMMLMSRVCSRAAACCAAPVLTPATLPRLLPPFSLGQSRSPRRLPPSVVRADHEPRKDTRDTACWRCDAAYVLASLNTLTGAFRAASVQAPSR